MIRIRQRARESSGIIPGKKSETVTQGETLPAQRLVLAAEIADDLETALEQFRGIAKDLE